MIIIARAYAQLRTERTVAVMLVMSKGRVAGSAQIPGPIPWSAMLRWCEWNRLERAATNHVVHILGIVDAQMRMRSWDKFKSLGR